MSDNNQTITNDYCSINEDGNFVVKTRSNQSTYLWNTIQLLTLKSTKNRQKKTYLQILLINEFTAHWSPF